MSKSRELRYPIVSRGEVYLCDFGKTRDHEIRGIRYAIIVSNNLANQFSPNVTVLPCTTQVKKSQLPVHSVFQFSKDNIVDYNPKIGEKINVALGESVKEASKTRLLKYLGKLTDSFMKEYINPILRISLDL